MFLVIILFILSTVFVFLLKKTTYITDKEKEFIIFAIDIFIEHSEDFNITSKDQHEKLVKELEKIKTKYFKTKIDEKT